MIYHQFEKDKKDLAQQYKNINWNTESGKSVDQLRAECETICQDMDGESRILIKAELFKHIMQYAQLEVNEKDWFANKINHGQIITDIRTRWITQLNHGAMADILQENEGFQECRAFIGDVDFGHVAPDWYVILEEGIPGILSKIQSMKTNRNLSKDQEEFYQACETVYEALICYMNRLAQEAERCAGENEKMAIVAENLRNLTGNKPQTLLEGMQLTVIFYYIQTWVEGTAIRSLGGLDRLYFSLYQNDLKTGKYSENQIREFMDYFLYEFYAMGATANTPFYLCGVERDGNLVYNELSSLILEEYVKLNVHDPKIHIRYGKDLPETFLKKVLEHIRNGNNSIVFMNDDIVIKSLMASGEMLQDARDYVTIGCYEPAALGKEVPCTSAGRVNIAKALELVMNHGVDMMTGKKLAEVSENSDTFDAFYESVKDMIALLIRRIMDIINGYESQYRNLNPSPMFSATLEDCLMKGKDAYEGGLKYNNTSVSPFGMATMIRRQMR